MLEKADFRPSYAKRLNIDAPKPDLCRVDGDGEQDQKPRRQGEDRSCGQIRSICTTHIFPWLSLMRHAGYILNTHIDIDWIDSERTLTRGKLRGGAVSS